jgi:hypothetical protein
LTNLILMGQFEPSFVPPTLPGPSLTLPPSQSPQSPYPFLLSSVSRTLSFLWLFLFTFLSYQNQPQWTLHLASRPGRNQTTPSGPISTLSLEFSSH